MVARTIHLGTSWGAAPSGDPVGVWNPSWKSSRLDLSNSDHTWTINSADNWGNVMGTGVSRASEICYFEQTPVGGFFQEYFGIGMLLLVDLTSGLDAPTAGAANTFNRSATISSSGVYRDFDSADHNTTIISGGFTIGDVIGIAVDPTLRKMWFNKNGGAFNPSVGGTQNPVTGDGGLTLGPHIRGTAFHPIGGGGSTGDAATAIFERASWTTTGLSSLSEFQIHTDCPEYRFINLSSVITCTASSGLIYPTVDPPQALVDGSLATNDTNSTYFLGGSVAGHWIQFDFGVANLVNEAIWIAQGGTHGSWKWQGSANASSWTDIGSSFTLGTASDTYQYLTELNGNTTAYRYYRILGLSGSVSTLPYLMEMLFQRVVA